MSVTRDDQSTLVLRCVNVLVTSSSEVTCPHLAPARYQEFGGNHLTVAARRIEPSDQADSTLRMRDLTMHICPELLVPICQDGTLSTYCDKPSLCLQCPHQAPDQATHIDFLGCSLLLRRGLCFLTVKLAYLFLVGLVLCWPKRLSAPQQTLTLLLRFLRQFEACQKPLTISMDTRCPQQSSPTAVKLAHRPTESTGISKAAAT